MGGNALKTATRRIESAAEFETLVKEIVGVLRIELAWEARAIPWYRSKTSFGDVDILVDSSTTGSDWVETIKKKFQPKEAVKNGSVFSFEYKDFQVDLIRSPTEEFNFAFNYFAWNDLGNFIGRTAHRLGFKFGHNGLWYVLRDPEDNSRVINQILVTQEFSHALEFLGFDPKTFQKGFDTPESIFTYAVSSCYFDPRQFLLSNRSYAARVRDAKRKMYHDMLQFIRLHYPDISDDCKPLATCRESHLQRAFNRFIQFREDYHLALHAFYTEQQFKSKFNGNIVKSVLHLDGKELGAMMQHLNRTIDKYQLKPLIIDLLPEQVESFINILSVSYADKG